MDKQVLQKELLDIFFDAQQKEVIVPLTMEGLRKQLAQLREVQEKTGDDFSALSIDEAFSLKQYISVLSLIDVHGGDVADISVNIKQSITSHGVCHAKDVSMYMMAVEILDGMRRYEIDELKKKVHHNDGHYGH